MFGFYLFALLLGYASGIITILFYQWLLRQLGHEPYLEVWQPRVSTPRYEEIQDAE